MQYCASQNSLRREFFVLAESRYVNLKKHKQDSGKIFIFQEWDKEIIFLRSIDVIFPNCSVGAKTWSIDWVHFNQDIYEVSEKLTRGG